jgi:5-(carboxyamino)imidazole ribonucleotide synthase
MPDRSILAPGATIGILGGGQLGRMIALAAAELGMRCHVFCPDADEPALDVAAGRTIAPYEDSAALDRFAGEVDCATIEFENLPLEALDRIAQRVPMRPGSASLRITQDRLAERRFVEQLDVAVAPYIAVERAEDLETWDFAAARAVLKTRRLGYDGKGQAVVANADEAAAAFARLGARPAILERFIPFRCEASAIVARGASGAMATFEPTENEHRNHILAASRVPASLAPATVDRAIETARSIATALDHVGVLAVEYFVTGSGSDETLLVNEIAPRVHNSGHWTQDGANVSQFTQHIRAIAGWPLVTPRRLAATRMVNLIGDEAQNWLAHAAEPGARLHLYGKREARPGRKMGHVNHVAQGGSESGAG